MNKVNLKNITVGEILWNDYMKPMNLTASKLARGLEVSAETINELIDGTGSISLDVSRRLGKYFGQADNFWRNVQRECESRIKK
jgi:addiction module HigA family antidote